jgi:hypothetical protein
VLPEGWKDRLVSVSNENTRGVVARCLEPHDLAVAKLVAGREKDLDFLVEMARHRMLDEATMQERIAMLPPDAGDGVDLHQRWARVVTRASA